MPSTVKLLPRPDKSASAPHLSKTGYSTAKKASSRHSSLKKASAKYGTLPVLKRLNLIRNITAPDLKAHKVMSQDVEYMKKMYKHEKHQSRSKGSKKTSKKGSKRGSKKTSKRH
jgi:hypothetical protein